MNINIDIEKLVGHESDLYLQSFQALLVGYTDVRVGATTRVQMAFWMIQSLSNLGLKVFSSDDEEGTVNEIDPALWGDKPLHGSVVPSFQSCNLERRYELELLLGFQCNSPKVSVWCQCWYILVTHKPLGANSVCSTQNPSQGLFRHNTRPAPKCRLQISLRRTVHVGKGL